MPSHHNILTRYMFKLFRMTPEFKVLRVLLDGDKSFTELKMKTGLSSRWLNKILLDLLNSGLIRKVHMRYQLHSVERIREIIKNQIFELNKSIELFLPSVALHEKAVRAARLIGQDENVLAVVLFGSVAKGTADSESDIDLLVITLNKVHLTDKIYDVMVEVESPIEALVITFRQMLSNLLDEPIMLFGILEGYEVLYDKNNVVGGLLKLKRLEIKKRWFYDEEEGIWLEKRLMHCLKRLKTN